MLNDFQSISNRIRSINFFSNPLDNIEMMICFSYLEENIYGVFSQFIRIISNLKNTKTGLPLTQARLDIFYYTLTWDRLKESFERLKRLTNKLLQQSINSPEGFLEDYRSFRIGMEHLLNDFETSVRNEYVHPSLEPKETGNIREWGTITTDIQGNINVHVGKQEHAIVSKKHIDLLEEYWIILIDIFIQYFTDKPLTSDLLNVKNSIESQIDKLVEEYHKLRQNNHNDEAGRLFHKLIFTDIHLTREGIQLNTETKDKIYKLLN